MCGYWEHLNASSSVDDKTTHGQAKWLREIYTQSAGLIQF